MCKSNLLGMGAWIGHSRAINSVGAFARRQRSWDGRVRGVGANGFMDFSGLGIDYGAPTGPLPDTTSVYDQPTPQPSAPLGFNDNPLGFDSSIVSPGIPLQQSSPVVGQSLLGNSGMTDEQLLAGGSVTQASSGTGTTGWANTLGNLFGGVATAVLPAALNKWVYGSTTPGQVKGSQAYSIDPKTGKLVSTNTALGLRTNANIAAALSPGVMLPVAIGVGAIALMFMMSGRRR